MSYRRHQDSASASGSGPSSAHSFAGSTSTAAAYGTHPGTLTVGVSATVGHDHWANDVLDVVGDRCSSPTSSSNAATAGFGESSHSPTGSLASSRSGGGGEQDADDHHHAETLSGVERKVLERKRKFHTGRPLEVKNLPEGCTEQDVREAFPELGIVSVTIETNDGRYKAGARLSLEYPELLDDWPDSRQTAFVKNKEVSVCVGNSDGWLCVAKLPLDYSDDDFFNLAGAYGKVREAFLMVSEKTAESKGYGLIKYVSSDAAAQARHLLDGRTVTCPKVPQESYSLDCDWLNSSHISFKSLHSKALAVSRLPPNYRDMGDFRRIFSVVKTPPYCQIAMPKGVIQDWGLVEFFDPEVTEATQVARNGHDIQGHKIRVHYCIPGVSAINIYMQAVNAPADSKKTALLNDGPTANVYTQLRKLAGQNPGFAQNLQNIIQDQIHNLSSGQNPAGSTNVDQSVLPATTNNHQAAAPTARRPSAEAPLNHSPLTSMQYHQPAQWVDKSLPRGVAQLPPQSSSSSGSLNSDARAALMILLTAQMQSQAGESSILHNPQVVSILQNLVSQAGNPIVPCGKKADVPSSTDLLHHPALNALFENAIVPDTRTASGGYVRHHQQQGMQRTTLLEATKPTRPTILAEVPSGYAGLVSSQPAPNETASPSPSSTTTCNLNGLLNAQNLSQLLGSLTGVTPTSASSQMNHQRPVLLGNPPHQAGRGVPEKNVGAAVSMPSLMSFPPPPPPLQTAPLLPPNGSQIAMAMNQLNGVSQPPNSKRQDIESYVAQAAAFAQHQAAAAMATSGGSFLMAYPGVAPTVQVPITSNGHIYGAPQIQPFGATGMAAPTIYSAANPTSQPLYTGTIATTATNASPLLAVSQQTSPTYVQQLLTGSYPQTPVGSKRKLSIPPSPEASPVGSYIGQHSQGIGGHYADSYWTTKTGGGGPFKRPRF